MSLGVIASRPWRPQPRLVRGAYESGCDSQPPLVTLTTLGVAHPPLGLGVIATRSWRPQPRLVRGAYESGCDSQPPLVTLTTLGAGRL